LVCGSGEVRHDVWGMVEPGMSCGEPGRHVAVVGEPQRAFPFPTRGSRPATATTAARFSSSRTVE
jgi:hypothetical protein